MTTKEKMNSMRHHRVVVTRHGGPDVLQVVEEDLPEPHTPGQDIVGVVDKLGDGVSTVEPGQKVAGFTFGDGGGYTEFICRPASQLVPVPAGVDPAESICLVVNYLTTYLAMHRTANVRWRDGRLLRISVASPG